LATSSSRQGLPIEYLMVPSPSMNRQIKDALVSAAQMAARGFHSDAMWGAPYDPAWAQNDPRVNAAKLVTNNTRIWVYTGNGGQSDFGGTSWRSVGWKARRASATRFSEQVQSQGQTQRRVQLSG
jgi:S-formylglutathione hydrolase FrmB